VREGALDGIEPSGSRQKGALDGAGPLAWDNKEWQAALNGIELGFQCSKECKQLWMASSLWFFAARSGKQLWTYRMVRYAKEMHQECPTPYPRIQHLIAT
jgi:hypothetical protein